MTVEADVLKQRQYYTDTANNYDELHLHADQEHMFALEWLSGLIRYTGAQSLLDVGCGTGRALIGLKTLHPNLRVLGIEPVEALRKIAIEKGLTAEQIVDGDALALGYAADSFDIGIAGSSCCQLLSPNSASKFC